MEPIVVLFDGECVLCQGAVRWLLRNDPAGTLRFGVLDSPGESMVAIEGGVTSVRGDAVLAIARRLRAPWPLVARFGALVPRALRDATYDAIARRRVRWFGRAACLVPSADERERFL